MKGDIINASEFKRSEIDNLQEVAEIVKIILKDIQTNGDVAVNQWSSKIDGQQAQIIKLLPFADYQLDADLSFAIKTAHTRIQRFCLFQIQNLNNCTFNDDFGTFGYIYQPIESIGAYIPGGKFPLISTALMTLTPAQVAGCSIRIACSPSIHPALLAAASLAGATELLHCGGAQAIGALSYGFDSINPVNMIVGPGNVYVNNAKAQVQSHTKIDTLAGPSELLIYTNELINPNWIILDALAQAEHDASAISLIVSTSFKLLEKLYNCTKNSHTGFELIKNKQIQFIYAEDNEKATQFINNYAPEHLLVTDKNMTLSQFKNYGSLFIGENSAIVFGDYCTGPNHTLPTNGCAKSSGGLSVHQFLKVLSTQKVNNIGKNRLAKISAILAKAEGLTFHQQSAEIRIQ
ncbi:MAG: histidinol dehydrogenase [Proteobacteria bacterium]|nr:histidinol dehydrogenase [Pseudomonadota bacterium]